MVVNDRLQNNLLNNFQINEDESEEVSLDNLSINESQTNIIKHSWQYTVQLNPITFYENNSDIQPNNEQQVWKETHYLSLYKNVLSILNKITWTTFDQLVDEFQKLPIENVECLENIANIVALKAFDEPSFGSLYASLCRVIDINITCQSGDHLTYQKSFKKSVITICQNYFKKQCLDDTETLVMSIEHEQNQRRLKMQAIGCVRFIGEMFKQSLISPYVVHYCIKSLQPKIKERSLEYLCNLLKVAGKELNEKVFFIFIYYSSILDN
ncbi:hypothetical protein ACI65C_002003 [Semiaphis heraclei]